jgi:hypothetical protein
MTTKEAESLTELDVGRRNIKIACGDAWRVMSGHRWDEVTWD